MNPQGLIGFPSSLSLKDKLVQQYSQQAKNSSVAPTPKPQVTIPIPNDRTPSTAVTSGVTYNDVMNRRNQLEQQQTTQSGMDGLLSTLQGTTKLAEALYGTPSAAQTAQSAVLNQQRASEEQFRTGLQGMQNRDTAGRRQELLDQAGAGQARTNLSDSNVRLAQLQGDLAAARPLMESEAGQTRIGAEARLAPINRMLTAEITAEALVNAAYSNNLKLIEDTVQQTLDDEFGDEQAAIDYYRNVSESYKREAATFDGEIAAEAEKKSKAIDLALKERERKLTEDRAQRESVLNIATEALKNGAPLSKVQNIMYGGVTPEQALSQLGNYMVDPLDRQIKQAQLNKLTAPEQSGIDWGQRANIIKLAADGDPLAIASLGYDPRTKGLTPEQTLQSERKLVETSQAINLIDGMLKNNRGIGAITGQVKSPTISGFFSGGRKDGSAASLVSLVPVVGNIQGAIQSRNDRDKILTDLQYLYNSEGFKEFIGLKESGLTFGSLTEGERAAIFSAANRLNSGLVIGKDASGNPSGRVEDYQGSEESLRNDLLMVQKGLRARDEELSTRLMLAPDEMQQLINL
jgi:hypothetical protein